VDLSTKRKTLIVEPTIPRRDVRIGCLIEPRAPFKKTDQERLIEPPMVPVQIDSPWRVKDLDIVENSLSLGNRN
jgi:hypothetical protein